MKRFIIGISLLLIPICIIFLQACQHDPGYLSDPNIITSVNCSPDKVYFVYDVLPLLLSSCGLNGCHDPLSAQAGVIMTDYVNVVQTGDVKPGKPKRSKLYKVITGGGEESMPPSSQHPLTSEQKNLISKWIEQGAWNMQCLNENCDTNNYSFSGAVWPTVDNNCAGCHSGSNPGAGIILTDHQHIAAIAIDPRFMGSLTHTSPYKFMPWNGNKLSDCKITQIRKWIEAGTPDN